MKALYIRQHGDVADLKVTDVAPPSFKRGETPARVLVQVEASGINPSDVLSAQGRFPDSVLPRILGRDFAGKIIDGPADLIGVDVWGSGGDLGITHDGTHAEFVSIPVAAVAHRPSKLSATEAAAVGVPYVTAFSALVDLGGLMTGEWVIVSGAAGAVGCAAMQIARARGAKVIALVKDASDRSLLEAGLADAVAQSDMANLAAVVSDATQGKGADLALNGVGASVFSDIMAALKTGGRQVLYSAAGGREFPLDLLSFYRKGLVLFGLNTQLMDSVACAEILKQLAPLFETGLLKAPIVAARYPLSSPAEAYGLVAARTPGKVIFVL